MGLFDFLGGRSSFREPFTRSGLSNNVYTGRRNFSDILNQVTERGRAILDEPRLSADDLFGESLQRLRDTIGANANSTKQAISRSLLSGAGDVSGSAGARLLGVTGGANEQLGKVGTQFSELADRVNRQRLSRGDQLLSQGLQGTQNLLSMDQSMLSDAMMREIQREQARKERGASVFGSVLSTLGTIGGAAVGAGGLLACWVAEELYGEDSPKVTVVRHFLLSNEGQDNIFGEFYSDYKAEGRQWAELVRTHKPTRVKAEKLFNELYQYATG